MNRPEPLWLDDPAGRTCWAPVRHIALAGSTRALGVVRGLRSIPSSWIAVVHPGQPLLPPGGRQGGDEEGDSRGSPGGRSRVGMRDAVGSPSQSSGLCCHPKSCDPSWGRGAAPQGSCPATSQPPGGPRGRQRGHTWRPHPSAPASPPRPQGCLGPGRSLGGRPGPCRVFPFHPHSQPSLTQP